MINSILKVQKGATTLLLTAVLLMTATLIITFAATFSRIQQKIASNQYQSSQAFQASEAGLAFGIVYLKNNSAIILANPVGGYIPAFSDSNTSNFSLPNGSKYTIVYTNPIANNYKLIHITVTGTSADGTSTKQISQDVQFNSLLLNPPSTTVSTKGNLSIGGSSQFINTETNKTVQSGGTVTFNGSGQTVTSSGTSSTSSSIKSDVQQNVSSTQSMSNDVFFQSIFGASMNTLKSTANYYYQNNSNTTYNSQLNGVEDAVIWIEQTGGNAQLNSNVVIGSPTHPVLLIVNGNIDFSGGVTIYGFVFVNGTTSAETNITGSVAINGGIATTGDLGASGNTTLQYSSSILQSLQNIPALSNYAKVPGSWKDM